jgi:hypothetical protein
VQNGWVRANERKLDPRKSTVAIAFSRRMPSRLILPAAPGVDVPTGLPPCPGFRGEPCRSYQPFVNRTTPVGCGARPRVSQ